MPPRRSSRAASAKPTSKPPSKIVEKPPSKLHTNGNTSKRAASPERSTSPPPKRSRTNSTSENVPPKPTRKPLSNFTSTPAITNGRHTAKKAAKLSPVPESRHIPPPQTKPYFNPLPSPPSKHRPGLVLFAWGAGNFGQFGMGPDILHELSKPKRNAWVEEQMEDEKFGEDAAGFESMAAGGLHSVFVDERGTVWTCGVNDDAALGRVTQNVPDPNNPDQFLSVDELTSYPHPIQTLIDEKFRAIKVIAGDSISAALSAEGELRVWGSFRANEGSLGFSDGLKNQFHPVPPALQLHHKPGDTEKIASVASGTNHLLVLTTHGNVYAWGASEQGQLGRKVLERRKIHGTVPEKITLGSRTRRAVMIGAGSYHSFAVDENGDVWGWGLNTMGQTGTGYTSSADSLIQLPQKVKRLSKDELDGDIVVEIVGGAHHTLFRTNAGKVYAVGRSNAGQLGIADDDPSFKNCSDPDFIPEPALVTFPDPNDPIVQVSCGVHSNGAVTKGGALYTWGQGLQGELGVAEEEVRTPRVIVRKEGGSWHAAAVACGGQHTLGLFRKK